MTLETKQLDINKIQRDTSRFQFRTADFSQERVDFLIANWDESILDPLDVWQTEDGTLYLLAGHHRIEAAIAKGVKKLPSRVHQVTENVARTIALKSNANRLEYSPTEKCRCLTFLIEQEGLSKSQASKQMALNITMGAKYYSLRHLMGTKWEAHLDVNQRLLALAFIVGQNCETISLSLEEKNTIFDLIIEHDLNYRELAKLFKELKAEANQEQKQEQGTLFSLTNILTNKVIKVVKKADKLQALASATWWLYELIDNDQKRHYQVPEQLKLRLKEELSKLYAFAISSDKESEIPVRNSVAQTQKIKQLKSTKKKKEELTN